MIAGPAAPRILATPTQMPVLRPTWAAGASRCNREVLVAPKVIGAANETTSSSIETMAFGTSTPETIITGMSRLHTAATAARRMVRSETYPITSARPMGSRYVSATPALMVVNGMPRAWVRYVGIQVVNPKNVATSDAWQRVTSQKRVSLRTSAKAAAP